MRDKNTVKVEYNVAVSELKERIKSEIRLLKRELETIDQDGYGDQSTNMNPLHIERLRSKTYELYKQL